MARRVTNALVLAFLLPVLLTSCSHLKLDRPVKQGDDDWPTHGRDPARVNMTHEAIVPPLTLAWSADLTGSAGNGSPVLVDSLLVVGTLRGELYVLDIRNGKRLGWLSLGDAIQGSPVVSGQVVYVALSNTTESLVAYDMSAGRKLWTGRFGDIEVSPLLTADRLYFGTTTGEFLCVETDRGEEVWKFSVPKNTKLKGIRSSAAVSGSTVVFGCDDGSVYAVHSATGELRWTYKTGASVMATPCMSDGLVFVGNLEGRMTALDVETGIPVWSSALGSPLQSGSAVSGNMILTATAAGRLIAQDRRTGTIIWNTDLGSVVIASPVVSGGYAYVGTLHKNLFGVDTGTGEIVFSEAIDGRVKTPAAVGFGKLFLASDEKWIFAFEERREE